MKDTHKKTTIYEQGGCWIWIGMHGMQRSKTR